MAIAGVDGQAAAPGFVHLRARSPFSLLEGAIKISDLAKLAKGFGMPALGLCDTDNLFGALEFSEGMKAAGLQPVMGMSVTLSAPRAGAGARPWRGSVALLAQDETGWRRLMALASLLYLDPVAAERRALSVGDILAEPDGLILLSGGYDGLVEAMLRAGKPKPAQTLMRDFAAAFPDRFYVEIQRHGRADAQAVEPVLFDLADEFDLPVVATHEPFFAKPEHYAAHDALLCIAGGQFLSQSDRRRATPEHYFKSPAEMAVLFADAPDALAATLEIAQRCAFRPSARAPILPRFAASGEADEAEMLRRAAEAGLRSRLAQIAPAAPEEEYWRRLDEELGIIIEMQFAGYFLIVADFIQWAKRRDIPVGPGRGSGAGSLAAWALAITDLDPLRFGLLFERFLNRERISMPDFDVDFCQDRRGEVIHYVQEKYGSDRVAQIITFGTLQARAVVRNVGRVMEIPYPVVDSLAKLIPQNPAKPISLAVALEMEPRLSELRESNGEFGQLLDVSLQLEGLYRNASTHAAGVVIGDRPLAEITPLYRDPSADLPATQYNMKWVESAGLVKFDFLGLKTLTVIKKALEFLKARGIEIRFDDGKFDDAKAYALMASGHTLGVFQLESQGMRDTLRKVRPDCLEDIIALVSLYRPGPMKNIDTYVEVKSGRKPPDYLHPILEPILKETYGVIIYQEQVMQIAQILSGYSLGGADILRRAMGKKKKEEMDQQRERFIAGAAERGVDPEQAAGIFELVAEFAGYGFNKSHAAAYAAVAYQTAFLKANYPAEFLAASMSLERDDTDKLAAFHQEAVRLAIKVEPPDISRSAADFAVADGRILYALGAVKNVGHAAMAALCEARERGGAFRDLDDFARRLDPKILNRRAYENLARAGAFDALAGSRARAFNAAEMVLATAQSAAAERESAQIALFAPAAGGGGRAKGAGAAGGGIYGAEAGGAEWSLQERLDHEFASVGFYLSGHPLEDFLSGRKRRLVTLIRDLRERGVEGHFRMAGVILRKSEKVSQQGGRFAFVAFSDPSGEFEATIMPEAYAEYRALIEPGRMAALTVRARLREGEMRLSVDHVEALNEFLAANERFEGLRVVVREDAAIAALAAALRSAEPGKARLDKNEAGAKIGALELAVELADGRRVALKGRARLDSGTAAIERLRRVAGVSRVEEM